MFYFIFFNAFHKRESFVSLRFFTIRAKIVFGKRDD